ncbi:Pre-mRNA-splicing factor clf1 [Hondaea fermentalgiana]|uniref:Pre-mRNA-splicing factor clf1 n=1 Tax=Hondaea fermentalgiana TaxID=2315210 RepID=A0A2R5GAY3_9STRA|nr:Pre-mRNA-splicing factor clf1 [Hondaea fermentalgiana]|eukprot:GBG28176.1 Pre-mRNA-splicing factor clf1 [Hondaea fermentalgiana]
MEERQVKNRAPAQVQVTAEQLVRAAREHLVDDEKKLRELRVSTRIHDEEELRMLQAEKRRAFEDALRHSMVNLSHFTRYAKWEESQMNYRHARSVLERAVEGHNRDPKLWIFYADFEIRNGFVNFARNVLGRAVSHLPRMNQLWTKYVLLEESLREIDLARLVFERWMKWEPDVEAWSAYANFEMRHGEVAKARDVMERTCGCHPLAKTYIRYSRWEERNAQLALARRVLERAFEELDPAESKRPSLFLAFAQFEERCKEFERARAIYKQALELLPKSESRQVYEAYAAFERQHGDSDAIEAVLVEKRREQYEAAVKSKPYAYDVWFDWTRMEQAQAVAEAHALAARSFLTDQDKAFARKRLGAARDRVRATFDRAVASVPPSQSDKRMWKRYIYLWINFAIFEEMHMEDLARARAVYRRCLDCIPHKIFTFSKIWILAAQLEIRDKDLTAARKLLGEAIGRCPRDKIFKMYLNLELQLGNVDRCRSIYEKYLEFAPQNCLVWERYAALEHSVGETRRSRAIFELAINQPVLDMPETLWKRYIDFEIKIDTTKSRANARKLYERLLERTDHVKVWISFAKFEAFHNRADPQAGRNVFQRAYDKLKARQADAPDDIDIKEDRALLLRSWLDTERKLGDAAMVAKVQAMQPRQLKRRREMDDNGGVEEYIDYVFPDDPQKGLALLQKARAWMQSKRQKTDDANEIDLDDV